MKKSAFENSSQKIKSAISELQKSIVEASSVTQHKYIDEASPYSQIINDALFSYEELYKYVQIGLREAYITRPSLIRTIDMNLFVSCEEKTNREIVISGGSPYAYDDPEGRIELHHIGQKYDAPFAELTQAEHVLYGNSKMIHNNSIESWRANKSLLSSFEQDKNKYWVCRLETAPKYLSPEIVKPLAAREYIEDDELSFSIKTAVEMLLKESSVDDLAYIRDLAGSYVFLKQVGYKSSSEYLNRKLDNLSCMYCNSNNCEYFGTYKAGSERVQRYRCKTCGKTFSGCHKSIVSGSNMPLVDWLKLLDCLANGFSVAKTAAICNISERSALDNRFKLFYALKQLDDRVTLTGNVVIDETYFEYSEKGNKPENSTRRSHKRGHDSHVKGLGKNQVCVVCALDENGNSVARVCGRGTPSVQRLDYALNNSITKEDVSCLYSDKEAAIKRYAEEKEIPHKSAKLPKKGTVINKNKGNRKEIYEINRHQQRMNSYHNRLHAFMDRFSGISSKYLSGYAYLFAWMERNKHRGMAEAYTELLEVLTTPMLYQSADDITSGRFLPNPNTIPKTDRIHFKNNSRVQKIWNRYAKGESVSKLSREFKVSRQRIYQLIDKYREMYPSARTDKEIAEENALKEIPKTYNPYENDKGFAKDMAIYRMRQEWQGSVKDFTIYAAQQYGLRPNTIRNKVSYVSRVLNLHNAFYIYEEYEYKNIETLYRDIYDRYKLLEKDLSQKQKCKILSKETNYSVRNIERIIKIMETDTSQYFTEKIRKTPSEETAARDRALFIDYMRWTKEKADFIKWAENKYKLGGREIKAIIRYGYLADPKRYEIV